VTTIVQDVRYALRLLGRDRGFATLAVLTLALGVGATSAIFSVLNAVMLRPLPYADPDRLVMLRADGESKPAEPVLSLAEIRALREYAGTLAAVEGLVVVNGNLGSMDDAEPMERVTAASVTDGFLGMLGVRPAPGRLVTGRDTTSEAVLAVLISEELWDHRFGRDPAILERVILVNNMRVSVAGVVPRGFRLLLSPDTNVPGRIDIWFPRTYEESTDRFVTTLARLAPGASLAALRAELTALGRQLTERHPDRYAAGPLMLHAELLQTDAAQASRPALVALMGAVVFVLLIACANLANLLLARTAGRTRELAVRSAVGAGRGRLVRQLVTEGLILGVLGGAGGLLLALWAESLLLWLRPSTLPAIESLPLDARVFTFALVTTIGCSVLFSLVPAWQGARADPQAMLKQGARGATAGGRLRPALIVAEVALAIVLLAGAGLMLRTLAGLRTVPLGFEPAGVLTMQATMQPRAFREYEKKWQFYRTAMERIGTLPGVQSVSAIRPLPLEPVKITDRYAAGERELLAESFTTLPDYFATMGVPLVSGRDFTVDDLTHSRPVAIVDETFARAAWPGQDPLGRTIQRRNGRDGQPLTIIGIARHVRAETLRDDGKPQVYLAYHLYPLFDMAVVIKAGGDPMLLARPARTEIGALGGNRPVHDIRPMAAYVDDLLAESRFAVVLLGIFAGLALVLSAVGIYGVVSYATIRRTKEIGVRVALGATRRDILALVVGDGARWAAMGVIIGIAAALGLTHYLTTLLFEVRPADPLTLGSVSALLLAVALLACYVPARRAGRVEASVALRAE
jgi:putative ABC transport system permease protein